MHSSKVLLDSCIWAGTKEELAKEGYDVKWVGDFLFDPGDLAIIKLAFTEKRILITLDKDFGELAVFRGEPHYGIVRIVNFSATHQGKICINILNRYQAELANHAIITADSKKVRIRVAEF